MNGLLPVIFYFLVGILFLVCSQRSSLRLQTNDKPSAQQSNKICSGSNERFGFKVDTSVSSTNFVGRKLKKTFACCWVYCYICRRHSVCLIVYLHSSLYFLVLPMKKSHLFLVLCVFIVVGFWLFKNSQDEVWGLPCLFRAATGYSCPGCGAQRVFHSLMHGHFLEAIRYNYFLPWAVAFLLIFQCLKYFEKGRFIRTRLSSASAILVYVLITIFWVIIRNLYQC